MGKVLRIIAKEWLVVAACLFGVVFVFTFLAQQIGMFGMIPQSWSEQFQTQVTLNFINQTGGWLVVLILYVLVQAIRFTVWSVKKIKEKK